jgi:hypothetical protein
MEKKLIIPVARPAKLPFPERIKHMVVADKLLNPLGIALLLLGSTLLAMLVVKFGITAGLMAVIIMVAIPVVYGIVAYPRFGIIVFLIMAYFIMWLYKMGIEFPLGTLMDAMEGLFILSLFIRQRKNKDWSMFKGPITTMILVWISYNFIEVANPTTESRLAWVYTIRSVAVIMLMYFVFLYYITTKKFIQIIFKLWIGLAFFAALYGFKQEHVGFFPFEETFLHSDPNVALLLFIGGVWRKFSIFSDPVSFAYNMVTASLLCIGLITGPLSVTKKIILALLSLFFMLVMLYSGTRGAFVLIPATLLLLAVLKYNKQVMGILCVAAFFLAVLIYMPTSNQTLSRFQSAFRPSDDASFNLRKINQKRIQPYMRSHPLGGGLGAVGEWGKRFAPHSYLGTFQPDSGYVRVAVELGWIGLGIFCMLMFTILKTGINNYYKIKDPQLKSYCLAVTLIVFALNFGNYPQEALVQYPTNVYFYLVVALMVVTLRIDQQQNEITHARQ